MAVVENRSNNDGNDSSQPQIRYIVVVMWHFNKLCLA